MRTVNYACATLVSLAAAVGAAHAQEAPIQFVQTDRFQFESERLDWSVALASNRLVVTASEAVRAYARSGAAWVSQPIVGIANCPAAAISPFSSIALSDQWLVVGRGHEAGVAGFHQGVACVFAATPTGYEFRTLLTISDPRSRNLFGASVAVDGATIVVGAPGEDASPTIPRSGSAYVFAHDGATWSVQAKLIPPDGALGDQFGSDVAVDGDRVLVGAQHLDAAYIYDRAGSAWTLSARLTAPQAGSHVALEGDVAVVAGHSRDMIRTRVAPFAFVFERSGGVWGRTAQLQAHEQATTWGQSVTLQGGRLFVGAPGTSALVDAYPGTLSYYRKADAGWVKVANFDPQPQDLKSRIGKWVAAHGDRVVLSTSCMLSECNFRQTFYTFVGLPIDDDILLGNSLRNAAGAAGDRAGEAIAFADGLLVVGAPGDATSNSAGEVYVFALSDAARASPGARLSSKAVTLVATLSGAGGVIGDKFGSAVAASPDGATILVGVPGAQSGVGRALLYTRPQGGWDDAEVAADTFTAPATPDIGYKAFGAAVALSPDGTVVIGAPDATVQGQTGAGAAAAFVPLAAADYPATPTNTFVAAAAQANASFGAEVGVADDVIAVAAPDQDRPGPLPSVGAVYTFRRTSSDFLADAVLTAPSGAIGDKFGTAVVVGSVGGAEPVIVVGSPGREVAGEQDVGAGWVYEHDGDEFVAAAQLLTAGRAFDRAGRSITFDVNTVVVGAPDADRAGETNSGSAFLFRRPAGGWLLAAKAKGLAKGVPLAATADLELPPAALQSNQFFGAALAVTNSAAYVSAAGRDVITANGVRPAQGEVDVFLLDRIFAADFE